MELSKDMAWMQENHNGHRLRLSLIDEDEGFHQNRPTNNAFKSVDSPSPGRGG